MFGEPADTLNLLSAPRDFSTTMVDSPKQTSPAAGSVKRREKPQQVADTLRQMIVSGEFEEGELLGNEAELIERFSVSRPSLREALRILETEGLISVRRGVLGGVVVHHPDQRQTARTAALVLASRNVALADVYAARTIIEPAAVRTVAASRGHKAAAKRLRALIEAQEESIGDPAALGVANARFHAELVALADNQTLIIVNEMLNEVVERAVAAVSGADESEESIAWRRRGTRSQRRLVELIADGKAEEAEEHWRAHMAVVGRVLLGHKAQTVVDLMDHV
mgnify:CR=1 FL=1